MFGKMCLDFDEMLPIILGSIALGAIILFLLKKDPEPLVGIYAQPGISSSCVVYCIFAC